VTFWESLSTTTALPSACRTFSSTRCPVPRRTCRFVKERCLRYRKAVAGTARQAVASRRNAEWQILEAVAARECEDWVPDGTQATRSLAPRRMLWHPDRMREVELLSQLHDRLNEHMRVVEDILEEIRDEVQWGVRNDRIRVVSMAADPCADDMRLNEADQVTMCPDCETEVPNLAEAIRRGWTDLRQHSAGFLGRCPDCARNNSALDEADARDAGTTICAHCDAETESPSQAKDQGWTKIQTNEPASHVGECPGCQTDEREPGRLF
jgi:hypothetical protein